MSDFVYTAYVIEYDEIKKVVPNEASLFEERADKVLVFLKLAYPDKKFTMNDIFDYCAKDDIDGCRIYKIIDNEDFHAIEEDLQEVYGLLWGNDNSVIRMFAKTTNVELGMDYNYKENKAYFYLHETDLIQLTPSGQALKEKGVRFEFEKWEEIY
jgi:hypothetical protein